MAVSQKKRRNNMKVKDGWHRVYGHDVYVEDGRVLRGTTVDGQNTTYPYRWNRNCFVNVFGISFDSFRSGMRRNTIEMK